MGQRLGWIIDPYFTRLISYLIFEYNISHNGDQKEIEMLFLFRLPKNKLPQRKSPTDIFLSEKNIVFIFLGDLEPHRNRTRWSLFYQIKSIKRKIWEEYNWNVYKRIEEKRNHKKIGIWVRSQVHIYSLWNDQCTNIFADIQLYLWIAPPQNTLWLIYRTSLIIESFIL